MDHTITSEGENKGGWVYRAGLFMASMAGVAVLGLSLWLEPASCGVGSHEQLGLPRCGLYERTGWPCPTCGMTTAFALTVRGRVFEAVWVQPAGALAAAGMVAGVVLSFYGSWTGKRPDWLVKLAWGQCTVWVLAVILASWLWKCLQFKG